MSEFLAVDVDVLIPRDADASGIRGRQREKSRRGQKRLIAVEFVHQRLHVIEFLRAVRETNRKDVFRADGNGVEYLLRTPTRHFRGT